MSLQADISIMKVCVYADKQVRVCPPGQAQEEREVPVIQQFRFAYVPHPILVEATVVLTYAPGQEIPTARLCLSREQFYAVTIEIAKRGNVERIEHYPTPMHV